jgi:Fe2+ or Zn2+ uptake regulation protein
VPNPAPATTLLRDDLLAQLRSAPRPLSTTHLLANAPDVPVRGARQRFAPLREQIYRALCTLERGGLITRVDAEGRSQHWTASPTDADHEIAALESAFSIPSHNARHADARRNRP